MKITTSTYPRPGKGGFALFHSGQIDQMMEQGSGLIKAEYNTNFRSTPYEGRILCDKKEDTFHFVAEKEGSMTLITLKNTDFGDVIILVEP